MPQPSPADSTNPPVLTSAAACRDGVISVTFVTVGTLASAHLSDWRRHAHQELLEQSVLSLASYTRHFSLFATCFFCLFFLEDIHYLGFSFSWAISYFLNEIYFNSLKFQSRLGAKCCLQKIHLQPARHRCLSLCGVGNPNSISISMNFFFFFLFLAQFCFLLLILLLTGFLALAENSKSYSLCQPLGDYKSPGSGARPG